MKSITLSNNTTIPVVGYGTWKSKPEECVDGVKHALLNGYTHIDAAAIYGNEQQVAQGIIASNKAREEFFITSKVWNSERGYDKTMAAFEKTIADLQVGYLDLYLIHWPANALQFENSEELNAETWRALEDLYKQGKVKAIGVSNFKVNHLKALEKTQTITPMVNQIEFHPGCMHEDIVNYCRQHNIAVEAYTPLANGDVFKNETLIALAQKYNKSISQLVLRWVVQNDVIVLTKSVTPARIIENLNIFDFEISEEDMNCINAIEKMGSCTDSDAVTF